MFNQTTYTVNENAESAQFGLVFSGLSSYAITVQVFSTNGTATGGYCSVLINYQYHNGMINML